MRLFANRTTKPGDKWGFMRWYDIVIEGELYLSRLNLIKSPWFSVKLHWIHRPDPDRDLHDHPWSFVAFVLNGSYWEYQSKDPANQAGKLRLIRWFNYKNKTTAHRISAVTNNLLTLVFTGSKDKEVKDWGFYDEDTFKYTPWQEYV